MTIFCELAGHDQSWCSLSSDIRGEFSFQVSSQIEDQENATLCWSEETSYARAYED